MPNLPTHLRLALKVANRMAHPTIGRNLGSFVLGAASPDIRIMTKWKRDQTHFAPLTIERIGAGVEGLFQTHPNLADSSSVNDATKVFLSGYFTHLVADESWILEIYRAYFDDDQLFPDRVQANIWDRALQFDMDETAREELGDMEQVRGTLAGSDADVDVGFISTDTLGQWREWVTDFTTWEFTWERLRFAARRMYGDDANAMDMVDEFLQSVPASLERVYNRVPAEAIADYTEKVICESVRTIREYLGVPEAD